MYTHFCNSYIYLPKTLIYNLHTYYVVVKSFQKYQKITRNSKINSYIVQRFQ